MNVIYAAGLFDGEGYVRINRWEKPNSPHIRYNVFAGIGMTHRPVIVDLYKTFGGAFNINDHSKRNAKHRAQFVWNIASQKACDFLRQIRPHTVVKSAEIDVALALQERIDNHGVRRFLGKGPERAAELAIREDLYRRITELKHLRYPLNKDPNLSEQPLRN